MVLIMKRSLLVIAAILLMQLPSFSQIRVMVWNDEFGTAGLVDQAKWSYEVGGSGWGNNELQYYTSNRLENARVENGYLTIEARKEPFEGKEYTSARLVTTNKGDWLYGRFEVRAKLPGGKGTWPAIWMLPTNWSYGNWPSSGEIDIMEYVGYDPGNVHGSIHTEAYNHVIGTQKTSTYVVADAETTYHNYAIEWTSETVDFFIDNVKYYSFANEHKDYKVWPFDQPFHFILNMAVGGNWGGAQGVDPNIWPQNMSVDYARVYQNIAKSDIKVDGPANVTANATGLAFKTQNIVGATFQWSVPQGATILSGQGTNQIQVNWGTVAGLVQVQIEHPEAAGTYSKAVLLITSPTGDKFTVVDFNTSGTEGWTPFTSGGNTITLSKQDTLLLIKYSIVDPSVNPYVDFTFPNPISMASLSHLAIWMKTFNLSHSVLVRADPFDVDGKFADATPVFKFNPTLPDGVFHCYQMDFSNKWGSNTPTYGSSINKEAVAGIRFFVDYGFYGKVASDSLWIDKIEISKDGLTSTTLLDGLSDRLSIFPNPCSDYITIRPLNNSELPTQIVVMDMLGRTELVANSDSRTIDIRLLSNGFHLFRVTYKDAQYSTLILKK
ncbi:family 16 glycosylhydrolase [Williamwhitmania taraxaci]|uniref:Por secretion system C-terminal sorting domain-containing protein n=1 Tax=Williamwhitmania taraxaci TaxID=1640674 RepID=A0A1G6N325_9BACT|nr:family 16 glycosylhydrolase [Williamwhitmania taraxaci]SDC62220.1 Por secretion system C-terminal sorting domain-containing protein [Williamwhitmania taraxaci]